MKKLVFMFVAMAAMSFASCGGNAQGEAPAADSDTVEVVAPVDTVAADTAAADTTAAAAQAE